MKITMINGSPKARNSASETILFLLKQHCGQEIKEIVWNKMTVGEEQLSGVLESDVLVFAFPLYIDSVPSHLLRCLMEVEEYVRLHSQEKEIRVYVILNNGFFQGKQNIPAIEVMKHWTRRCGFCFGQAIGIGGGGMINFIKTIPDGHGPKKNLSYALKEMAENIMQGKSGETKVFEPNYPAFAYKWQAEYGWCVSAKKNGLKRRDLDKKW